MRYKFKKMIILLVVVLLIFPTLSVSYAYTNNYYDGIYINNRQVDKQQIVKGIVEENNPNLGYITLYNEDGTGINALNESPWLLRTYNYINPDDIEVQKDKMKSDIFNVEEGDSVFIMLDEENNLLSISAASNYISRSGKLISRTSFSLTVGYDDNTQQVLKLDNNILIIEDGKLSNLERLKYGDRIKLILQVTNRQTSIKQITIGENLHPVSNIYKAIVSRIDLNSNKLIFRNMQFLKRDAWYKVEQKGFVSLKLSDEYKIFFDNKQINLSTAKNYLRNKEVYIAVEKSYGGEEKAILVSFRNQKDTEVLYNDEITGFASRWNRFSISTMDEPMNISKGTIVVKDGKLVSGETISDSQKAYIVANRDYNSGRYNAGIVYLKEKYGANEPQIYRGRIKSINEERDITLYSFSQLNGLNWEYSNIQKTFNITYDTRILGENGLVGTQNFVGYGNQSYVDSVVYIVADSINATLISTAPYGTINIKGEILKTIEENVEVHIWGSKEIINLKILKNTIIIKDNKVVKLSDLKKGDKVRAIKKEISQEGEAYIIIVEE